MKHGYMKMVTERNTQPPMSPLGIKPKRIQNFYTRLQTHLFEVDLRIFE